MKHIVFAILFILGMPWTHSQSEIEFGAGAYFIVDDWSFDSSNAPNID